MVMITPALREDRGFPLIPKTCILFFVIIAQWGGVREDRTPLFFFSDLPHSSSQRRDFCRACTLQGREARRHRSRPPFFYRRSFFIANHNTLGRPSVRIAALLFLRPTPYFDGLGTPAGGRETRSPFHPFLPSIAIHQRCLASPGGRNAPCVRPPFFLSKICFILS